MTTDPMVDPYLDSLRGDLPTRTDEARIARRLSAAGLVLSLSATAQLASASTGVTTGLAKSSLLSLVSARLLHLPLLAQMGLVTATTTLLATGPAVMVLNHYHDSSRNEQTRKPVAIKPQQTVATATTAAAAQERSAEPTLVGALVEDTAIPNDAVQTPSPVPRKQRAQRSAESTENRETQESSLAEETSLIDASLGAIRQGQFAQAEQLLRSHAERFPNGRLLLERLRAEQKLSLARERK